MSGQIPIDNGSEKHDVHKIFSMLETSSEDEFREYLEELTAVHLPEMYRAKNLDGYTVIQYILKLPSTEINKFKDLLNKYRLLLKYADADSLSYSFFESPQMDMSDLIAHLRDERLYATIEELSYNLSPHEICIVPPKGDFNSYISNSEVFDSMVIRFMKHPFNISTSHQASFVLLLMRYATETKNSQLFMAGLTILLGTTSASIKYEIRKIIIDTIENGLNETFIQHVGLNNLEPYFIMLALDYSKWKVDKEFIAAINRICMLPQAIKNRDISELVYMIVEYNVKTEDQLSKFVLVLNRLQNEIRKNISDESRVQEYENLIVKKLVALHAKSLSGEQVNIIFNNPDFILEIKEPDYAAWLVFNILQNYPTSGVDLADAQLDELKKIDKWLLLALKKKPETFVVLLKNADKLNPQAKKNLLDFIANNFGMIIESNILLVDLINLLAPHHEEIKIPYKMIIGYENKSNHNGILNSPLAIIAKLRSHNLLLDKVDRINALDNPLILAARAEDYAIIQDLFTHKDELPFKEYWLHAGDEENDLLRFLLVISRPGSQQIFEYACNTPSIVKYVTRDFFNTTKSLAARLNREDIYERNIVVLKKNIYRSNVFNRIWRKGVSNIWEDFLSLQTKKANAAGGMLILGKHEQEAHREDIEDYAYEILETNYGKFLDQAYPNLSSSEREKEIAIDARLLLIKQYIENEPSKNDKDKKAHQAWQEIIKCCDAEEYFNKSIEKKISFQEFKEFAKKKNSIMETVTNDDDRPTTLGNLLLSKQLDGNVYWSWQAFKPGSNAIVNSAYHGGQYQAKEKTKFMFFNALLITENVDNLVDNCNEREALIDLLKGNESPDQNELKLVRTELNKTNANIEELKLRVKNLLLGHQKTMAGVFQDAFIESKGVCNPGVITRFATRIIASHNKFFESPDRSLQIETYMNEQFGKFSEQFIIELLLSRLQKKIALPSAGNKSAILNAFSKRFRKPQQLESTLMKQIDTLLRNKPTNFFSLTETLKTMDLNAQRYIIAALFNLQESNGLHEPYQLATDASMKKLFDTLFSLNQSNFYDLFTGDGVVPAYSSLVSQTRDPNENLAAEVIGIDQFDTNFNRTAYFNKGFNTSQLINNVWAFLKETEGSSPPLTKAERAVARFYSLAGPDAEVMNSVAARNLESLKALMFIGPIDSFIYKLNANIKKRGTTEYVERDIINLLSAELNKKICDLYKTNQPDEIEEVKRTEGHEEVENIINKKYGIDTYLISKSICRFLLKESEQLDLLTYTLDTLVESVSQKIDLEYKDDIEKLRNILAKEVILRPKQIR